MKRFFDNVLLRLLVYYSMLLGIYIAILSAFPWMAEAIVRERARGIGAASLVPSGGSPLEVASVPLTEAEVLVPIALTLLGALGLALPVALTYQWTREPETYRRDFGRALIALPIAVALAVFLVKNSLALAFSLAGIVAAIRWRAALREAMDGVFMFVVIGIGLAAGVQLLMVALVASAIFNLMILALSRTAYAERPRQVVGWTLSAPARPEQGPRRRVDLTVDASDQTRAAAHVETILELCTKEWEGISAAPQSDGGVRLEYRATLRKRTTPQSLRGAILTPGVPEIRDVTTIAKT